MAGKLLVLQDSPQFGGHEIMFLKLLPAVLGGAFDEVVVRMPQTNRAFLDGLQRLGAARLRLQPWDFVKRVAEPYLADFRRRYAGAVRDLVEQERPSTILLLQGRIENLAVPMLAIPDEHFVVSYIPMAHSLAEMGRTGGLGDRIRRRLYRRPNRFVVPSPAVADQLTRVGARAPVVVVENVVDPPPMTRRRLRSELGLPPGRRIALFMGRFDTGQKGLDLLLDALKRGADRLDDWTFLFVGSGAGRSEIEAAHGLPGHPLDIRILPWAERPYEILQASDILLMPSRFEGVPLVMLEAMTCGLPILASDLDVFRDYLPDTHRADYAAIDLPERLNALASVYMTAAFAEGARSRIASARLDRSRARFAAALTEAQP